MSVKDLTQDAKIRALEERIEKLEKRVFGPDQNGHYKCMAGYAVVHKAPCKCLDKTEPIPLKPTYITKP